MNYDEHIEPSVSEKGSIYFYIFECGRNLIYQLDVTYQRALIASAEPSSVPKGYYQPYPAWEIFYDIMVDHILEKNDGIDKIELCKAVAHVKDNDEAEQNVTLKI